MIVHCLALVLVLLTISCGPFADAFPRMEEQDKAQEIVDVTFVAAGYEASPPIIVLWHADECLPEPWALGETLCDPEVHDCRCFSGRALYLIWTCVTAVRWRETTISDTSFAHEVGWHCGQFDPFHELALWHVVDDANNRLRREGL